MDNRHKMMWQKIDNIYYLSSNIFSIIYHLSYIVCYLFVIYSLLSITYCLLPIVSSNCWTMTTVVHAIVLPHTTRILIHVFTWLSLLIFAAPSVIFFRCWCVLVFMQSLVSLSLLFFYLLCLAVSCCVLLAVSFCLRHRNCHFYSSSLLHLANCYLFKRKRLNQ